MGSVEVEGRKGEDGGLTSPSKRVLTSWIDMSEGSSRKKDSPEEVKKVSFIV